MTLVELIVAIAIFTTILSGVVIMFNSVTNTVRRSYRTIDIYEQANSALQAMERDIQTMFNNPSTGQAIRFYGEPYGFVAVGVDENNQLSRVTYAIHRDASSMDEPASLSGRGAAVTLPRLWDELSNELGQRYNVDLSDYYHRPAVSSFGVSEWLESVDVEVEVITGMLLRFYERDRQALENFPHLDNLIAAGSGSRMPRPVFFDSEALGHFRDFPWLTFYIWPGENHQNTSAYAYNAFRTAEKCHYWMQMLNGPGIPPLVGWDRTDIWWRERSGTAVQDQFWFDEDLPVGSFPDGRRHHLQQYIVAENFVLHAYLLDPSTGQRIIAPDGSPVEILGPTVDPFFRYAVEDSGQRSTFFNTLFNINFNSNDTGPSLIQNLMGNLENQNVVDNFGYELTEKRSFYDLGNPLQGRAPVSLDICLWILQEAVTTGGATHVHRFAKTIYLPTGYVRPQQLRE